MKSVGVTLVLLLAVLSLETEAMPGSGKCEARYKDLMTEAVSVRTECGEMEIQDCCAATVMSSLHTTTDYHGSRIYEVQSSCSPFSDPFQTSRRSRLALCDTKTDNGGWIVVFRRDTSVTNRVSFDRDWTDYETGFGDLETEFWYGLREMHCLTQTEVEMRIDLTATNGTKFYWTYGLFKIDGPDTNYVLNIGEPVGSPGTHQDAITRHFKTGGTPFTTRDRDNDEYNTNCAAASDHTHSGGWWWHTCGYAHVTRLQSTGEMRWNEGRGYIPLSFVEMKIRPKSCQVIQSCSDPE